MPTTFTLPFLNTPAFYTGTAQTDVVPNLYPVAINGIPYLIDQKSGRYQRGHEPRVRDSQDISTAPGEAAINPGGLWRRGHDSWHLGAGQQYSDVADSQSYRFYKSKGVDVWTKGQISLLNDTVLRANSTFAATTQRMVIQDGRIYASFDTDVKYTTDPFVASPTWIDCTGEPGGGKKCVAMATDGDRIYFGFENDGVRVLDPGASLTVIDSTKFINTTDNYYMLGFAKGFLFGSHNSILRLITASGSVSQVIAPNDTAFRWVGVATGQNAVYAAGYASKKSLVFKVTIKNDGTLDTGIVALELPTGEIATSIAGYLGFIILGTNKGVRFCSTDSNSNLVAGQLIPTSGPVLKSASNDRFSYFTWTNYDGTSGGLGRLDLSTFTAPNTPAYATDLMYTSTADVTNVVIFDDKPVFMVSGVGVIVENTDQKVASGTIELGTYRWGIPDRKFVAKVDVRTEPLKGSVTAYLANDESDYSILATFNTPGGTEYTFNGSDSRSIETKFKLTLTRGTTVTEGPTVTRWMARAYAAPFRSEVFVVPALLHSKIKVKERDIYLDVESELEKLHELLKNPRIVTLQLGNLSYSVIVEDVEWVPVDTQSNAWVWDGTAVVTMRSVEN